MNFRFILTVAVCSVICFDLSAQSAADIATAKAIAKSHGYTDSQIDAYLNKANGQSAGGNAAQSAQAQQQQQQGVQGQQGLQPISIYQGVTEMERQELDLIFAGATETESPDEIYGHSFFKSPGLSRVPSYNAPAPDSYILGPGDEVVLDIWGSTVSHIVSPVSQDGSILIPDAGPMYISGITVKAAEEMLKSQLSKIYSGLSGGETFLSLSIGRIKGVVVNVSGEVKTPGSYNIPSLTSIPSAIFLAGGITDNGSVRNIRLYRGNKLVGTFDLYELIFKGRTNNLLRIQDGDIITVPSYEGVVKVEGSVMRPKRYELKEGDNIEDLIGYAQGFKTNSQRNFVNVSRVDENGGKSFDVPSSSFGSFLMKDGDELFIREFVDRNTTRISIQGPVKYPGTYALSENINDVASLIKAAGGLIEGAYTGRGQLTRLNENRQPVFRVFDLRKVMSGGERIPLKREDMVILYSFDDFNNSKVITVSGAVKNPGQYSANGETMLSRLIEDAGGLDKKAYLAGGTISREGLDGKPVIVPVDIQKALDDTLSVTVLPGDAVTIYSIDDIRQKAEVTIEGEVNAPGKYVFREGMTLSDLIEIAQGWTHGADAKNLEIARRGGRERGDVINIDTESDPASLEIELKPYDLVSVRRLTYFRPQIAVSVQGEVNAPGTYVLDKPQVRLSDVIARVGGFTEDAYPHGASLIRVLTEEEMDRQKEAVKIAAQQNNVEINLDSLELEDRFHIGIDLEKALSNPGSVSDVILRAGDIIEVPQMNNTVKISGGVLYPNVVSFNQNYSLEDYISQAGGYTKLARRNKVFAIYMNGQVAKKRKIVLEPGMEIYIPEKDPEEARRMTPAEIAAMASSATSVAALVTSIIKMF